MVSPPVAVRVRLLGRDLCACRRVVSQLGMKSLWNVGLLSFHTRGRHPAMCSRVVCPGRRVLSLIPRIAFSRFFPDRRRGLVPDSCISRTLLPLGPHHHPVSWGAFVAGGSFRDAECLFILLPGANRAGFEWRCVSFSRHQAISCAALTHSSNVRSV